MLWTALITTALAGYGDAVDGFPSHAEREMLLWTNAVRVAPEAFDDGYASGGCRFADFEPEEQSSKGTLAWHPDLNEAARVHSEDMSSHHFVDHDSSDGTGTWERIGRYYGGGGYMGENVAGGRSTAHEVVVSGWMCSEGHRANIMNGVFNEFGGGNDSVYWTQVFSQRTRSQPAIASGVHTPEVPGRAVTFFADMDSQGAPVDEVVVVVNGAAVSMSRAYGSRKLGVYEARIEAPEGCTRYHFEAKVDGVSVRFPEDGAYGFGDCAFDDPAAGWFAGDGGLAGDAGDKYLDLAGDRGCSTSGLGLFGLWLLPLLGLRRRDG